MSGGRPAESHVACKVLYRLAQYADQRYRDAVAAAQAPESVMQRRVIAEKRKQVGAPTVMAS